MALLLAFILSYLRPYHGIRHDSILYLGQALLRRKPEQFSQDLFFAFGSQAQFTLFPNVIAFFLSYVSPATLFQIATLLSLAAFAGSSAYLIRQIFPKEYRFPALLALLILPAGYGGWRVFSYAEPFFTARSLAEPLILLALAFWLKGKSVRAASLVLAAAAIHPLQALPFLLVIWIDRILHDQRWLHLLWLTIPPLVAGFFGIPPFDELTHRFDEQWLEWIEDENKNVFITRWQPAAWGYFLTDLFLGWCLIKHAEGILQRLARALWWCALIGFLAAFVVADIWRLTLFTGMQLWRAQWLLHWLAMASAPWLLHRQWLCAGGRWSPRFGLLVAIIIFGTPATPRAFSWLAALCFIPLYLYWQELYARVGPGLQRLLSAFVPIVLVLAVGIHFIDVWILAAQAEWSREMVRPEFVLFSHPLISGSALVSGYWLWQRSRNWRPAMLIFLLIACIHAGIAWDRRNAWTRHIEHAELSPKLFGIEIEPAAQIFWTGELLAPWLILNRPSYFNGFQTAGQLFNRGTAQEADFRSKVLRPLSFQLELCAVMDALNQQTNDNCLISEEIIKETCEKADGKLNYLVLDHKLATPALGSWHIVGGLKGDRPITYYLYRCSDFSTPQNKSRVREHE